MYQVPLVVYEELEGATPERKREIVLSLIEEHPEHRLELPERDGLRADLSGVDLSRVALQELVEARAGATPPWWNAQAQRANLRNAKLQNAKLQGANLQGADLFDAHLQGANLFNANLERAILWQAKLQGAKLEVAKLQRANLLGAKLQGAKLRHAKLQGACLDGASLQGANLEHANLQGAELWGAKLQGAELIRADLQGARLLGADLQGADLRRANLQGANLLGADLQRADLRQANLQGAYLSDANLRGADLRHAKLQGVDLSTSVIRHCYLSGAWLGTTRLRREQLGGAVGEELDGDYTEAKVAYRGVRRNFNDLGDHAGSSWAYRKERRMEKREALEKARDAHRRRDWQEALSSYAKVLSDQMVELVCDYGEGFSRVMVCLTVVCFDFALIYGLLGDVLADCGERYCTTRQVIDLLSFSLGAMVTIEAPGLRAYPSLLMRILVPLEAALGIFFVVLLGFVAGNHNRRS